MFGGQPIILWKIAGITFVNFSGVMVLPFLALYLTIRLGLSVQQVGPIMASYGVGSILGGYFGGRLSDSVGSRRALAAGYGSTGIMLLSMYFANTLFSITIMFFLVAFCNAGIRPAYNSCVIDLCPEAERSRAYALYLMAANSGSAIGAAIGGVIFAFNSKFIFLIDGGTCLLGLAGTLLLLPANIPRLNVTNRNSASTRSPWVDHLFWIICLSVLLFGAVTWQRRTTVPIYLSTAFAINAVEFGLMVGAGHLIYTVLAMPVTAIVKRYDPRLIAGCGALIMCLCLALMPLSPTNIVVLVLFCLSMVGEIVYFPAMVSIVMSRAAQSKGSGTYMGAYHSTQSVASVGGPIVGAYIYAEWGAATLWTFCGIIGITLFFVFAGWSFYGHRAGRELSGA